MAGATFYSFVLLIMASVFYSEGRIQTFGQFEDFTVNHVNITYLMRKPVHASGRLVSLKNFFVAHTPVRFQIWRPAGEGDRRFRLIWEYRYTPDQLGVVTTKIDDLPGAGSPVVERGDHIGVFLEQNYSAIDMSYLSGDIPCEPANGRKLQYFPINQRDDYVQLNETVTFKKRRAYQLNMMAFIDTGKIRYLGYFVDITVNHLNITYLLGKQIRRSGRLVSLKNFFVAHTPVRFQIWRPAGEEDKRRYRLTWEYRYTPDQLGVVTTYMDELPGAECAAVQRGDRIGIFVEQNFSSITYIHGDNCDPVNGKKMQYFFVNNRDYVQLKEVVTFRKSRSHQLNTVASYDTGASCYFEDDDAGGNRESRNGRRRD